MVFIISCKNIVREKANLLLAGKILSKILLKQLVLSMHPSTVRESIHQAFSSHSLSLNFLYTNNISYKNKKISPYIKRHINNICALMVNKVLKNQKNLLAKIYRKVMRLEKELRLVCMLERNFLVKG